MKQFLLNFAVFSIFRYTILAFMGFVLCLTGFIVVVVSWVFGKFTKPSFVRFSQLFGGGVFVVVVFVSGIFSLGAKISHPSKIYFSNSSFWQDNAAAIDSNLSPLCVPVLPLGWGVYGNDCRVFEENFTWRGHLIHYPYNLNADPNVLQLPLPEPEKGATLSSLGVYLQPVSVAEVLVSGVVSIELQDGRQIQFFGDVTAGSSGGFLQLSGRESVNIVDIVTINVVTDNAVVFGKMSDTGLPAVLWMGL